MIVAPARVELWRLLFSELAWKCDCKRRFISNRGDHISAVEGCPQTIHPPCLAPQEERRLAAGLSRVQQEHERDRAQLISDMLAEEGRASRLVDQLFTANRAARLKEAAEDAETARLLDSPLPSTGAAAALRKEEVLGEAGIFGLKRFFDARCTSLPFARCLN